MVKVNLKRLYSSSDHSLYDGFSNIIGLPQKEIDQRFLDVEKEVEMRWEKLTKPLSFPFYQMNQSEEVLSAEFKNLDKTRNELLFDAGKIPVQSQPDFKLAQNILMHHHYRQPSTITFEHSKADDSYNCTCIKIKNRKFFALDGPTEKTIDNFYRLLANWNVNSLVCLVDESENNTPKCFPYWKDLTFKEKGETFFCLPLEGFYEKSFELWDRKKILYLSLSTWQDHQALETNLLINAANNVRLKHSPNDLVAIHCSGGVGRTGTFLALICLLDDIDNQIKLGAHPKDVRINIAELFLKLNFHRAFSISKEPQYISLYRALDAYLYRLYK